jgi:hypothetical protein
MRKGFFRIGDRTLSIIGGLIFGVLMYIVFMAMSIDDNIILGTKVKIILGIVCLFCGLAFGLAFHYLMKRM